MVRRPLVRKALAGIAVAVLALAAACSDESDVVIVAITRTPGPQPTAASTSIAPLPPTAGTSTPAATASAVVPERPENVLAGANLLVPYLASGGATLEDCLPELAAAWGFADGGGLRCVLADLDGDRADEFALLVTLPGEGDAAPGDVWFFESADLGHPLLASARSLASAVLGGVRIVAAEDLTGDGLLEVVVSSLSCDAAICTSNFLIVSAHRGRLENLEPDEIGVPGLESATVASSCDEAVCRLDLVLYGGVVPGAGAGPPRPYRRTLAWSGLRFIVGDLPDPPRYLFHAIADADAMFASGDYAGAQERYEQAARDTALFDWKADTGQSPGRRELAPYALLRAGIAALRQGDSAVATALMDRAFQRYQSSLHGLLAAIYLGTLNAGHPANEACQEVETFLQSRSVQFEQIWDYGYANPEHTIAGICR